jgi:thiamine kinase-like enzyme
MIFGHGDLLHGNIIVISDAAKEESLNAVPTVQFIDYEFVICKCCGTSEQSY